MAVSTIKCNQLQRKTVNKALTGIASGEYSSGTIDISQYINSYNYVGLESLETNGINYNAFTVCYVSIAGNNVWYKIHNDSATTKDIGLKAHLIVQ